MPFKRIMPAVLAALLICGCSREGFEESLGRGGRASSEEPQPQSSQPDYSHEDYIFELDVMEYEEENSVYIYALPSAAEEAAEESAERIAGELEDIITSLPAEIADGRDYSSFQLYDVFTCNNGRIFSVMYEISFVPGEGEEENYIVGLVFDPVTGERMELSELIDPDTLITLITDEQASKISGRDEELTAKKRAYLAEQGDKTLKKRLTSAGGADTLIDSSYYVDGDMLVAVFSAIGDIGGAVEVSINL